MARGIKQIPAMSWIYIEEDTGDHNGFFLEEFFEERLEKTMHSARYASSLRTNQAIVQGRRKLL